MDLEHSIALHPARDEDTEFLLRVYSSTRADEIALVDWDEAAKQSFLSMQFAAQHRYYHENYQNADFSVVMLNGEPIGRLYVARWADEIRLMDVALLPEHRNAGIGTFLMNRLLSEAHAAGVPVRIHVEPFNPALRLYQRLGFRKIEERGVYWFMECSPAREEAG